MRKFLSTILSVAVVAAAFLHTKTSGAPSAQSRSGAAVAFAKIAVSNQLEGILTFGGKGTTSCFGSFPAIGSAIVTFRGKYPKDLTTDQVVINITASTGSFGVGNGDVVSANSTQIVVSVNSWVSDTEAV